jgi:hypothetical protein
LLTWNSTLRRRARRAAELARGDNAMITHFGARDSITDRRDARD